MFISTGASVSGVFWNTIFTPSSVISSKSLLISRFGAIRPVLPLATFLPIAWSTWPKRIARQQHRVLPLRAARHGVAGEHVLLDRGLHEALGRDHHDLAAGDVGLVDHAAHAAEVVDVRVRVDDADHRPLAELLVDELERRARGFLGGQRVEHDPAGIALDEADVGQVEAAHLVDRPGTTSYRP